MERRRLIEYCAARRVVMNLLKPEISPLQLMKAIASSKELQETLWGPCGTIVHMGFSNADVLVLAMKLRIALHFTGAPPSSRALNGYYNQYKRLLQLWKETRSEDGPFWTYPGVSPRLAMEFVTVEFPVICDWHRHIFRKEELGVCYFFAAVDRTSVGLFKMATRLFGPSRTYDMSPFMRSVFVSAHEEIGTENIQPLKKRVLEFCSRHGAMSPRVLATLIVSGPKKRIDDVKTMIGLDLGACSKDDADVRDAAAISEIPEIRSICERSEAATRTRIATLVAGPNPEEMADMCSRFPEHIGLAHFMLCHPANDESLILNVLSARFRSEISFLDLTELEMAISKCSQAFGNIISTLRMSDLLSALQKADPHAWLSFVAEVMKHEKIDRCPIFKRAMLATLDQNLPQIEAAPRLEVDSGAEG